MDSDQAKGKLQEALSQLQDLSLTPISESDTRSKIIDYILLRILGWEEKNIEREHHQSETGGYVDYILSTARPILLIEAKNANRVYELPGNKNKHCYLAGGVLTEDKNLKKDLHQAKSYAVDSGVGFGCLTNGHQFLFFRPGNNDGIPWAQHEIIIFRSLQDVLENFDKFYEACSYDSVSSGRAFKAVPINASSQVRESRFLKPEGSSTPTRPRERNRLFPIAKEILDEAFQDLTNKKTSPELIKQCYVESARDSSYSGSLQALIKDRSVFVDVPTEKVSVSKKGAPTFERIIHERRDPETILLLGGVGAGKSTFIQRFRLVIASKVIEKNCIWAYVDLTEFSDTGESISNWLTEQILAQIEENYPAVGIANFSNIKQAYHKEYERLKNGRLKPVFDKDPSDFEIKFADEVGDWEQDNVKHVSRLLSVAARNSGRRPFLVFDNADQFEASTQDKIFRIANEMVRLAECSAIISLREESYWRNKDFGTLSAFHAKTFHVASPRLLQVLSKRFKYVEKRLSLLEGGEYTLADGGTVSADEIKEIFDLLRATVLESDSEIVTFLECLSPGEIRRPLDQVARFLYSGHTNIDSLLRASRRGQDRTIGFHEFLTSVALGDQDRYREDSSDIVNLFRVVGAGDASNLNTILVLSRLIAERRNQATEYGLMSVDALIGHCAQIEIRGETVLEIVERLNKKRLIETRMQIREAVSTNYEVRATSAADYYFKQLASSFAYIDLILDEVEIGNEVMFSQMEGKVRSMPEYRVSDSKKRLKRVKLRAERAKIFGKYIASEVRRREVKNMPPSFQSIASDCLRKFENQLSQDADIATGNAEMIFGGR